MKIKKFKTGLWFCCLWRTGRRRASGRLSVEICYTSSTDSYRHWPRKWRGWPGERGGERGKGRSVKPNKTWKRIEPSSQKPNLSSSGESFPVRGNRKPDGGSTSGGGENSSYLARSVIAVITIGFPRSGFRLHFWKLTDLFIQPTSDLLMSCDSAGRLLLEVERGNLSCRFLRLLIEL